jgi:hypothetical protein
MLAGSRKHSTMGGEATAELKDDQLNIRCPLASIDERVPTLPKVLLCIARKYTIKNQTLTQSHGIVPAAVMAIVSCSSLGDPRTTWFVTCKLVKQTAAPSNGFHTAAAAAYILLQLRATTSPHTNLLQTSSPRCLPPPHVRASALTLRTRKLRAP